MFVLVRHLRFNIASHLVELPHVEVESLVDHVPDFKVLGVEAVVLAVLAGEVGGHSPGLVANKLPILDAGDVVLRVEGQVLGLHVVPRLQVHHLQQKPVLCTVWFLTKNSDLTIAVIIPVIVITYINSENPDNTYGAEFIVRIKMVNNIVLNHFSSFQMTH